jgi:hypothetical protein
MLSASYLRSKKHRTALPLASSIFVTCPLRWLIVARELSAPEIVAMLYQPICEKSWRRGLRCEAIMKYRGRGYPIVPPRPTSPGKPVNESYRKAKQVVAEEPASLDSASHALSLEKPRSLNGTPTFSARRSAPRIGKAPFDTGCAGSQFCTINDRAVDRNSVAPMLTGTEPSSQTGQRPATPIDHPRFCAHENLTRGILFCVE